MRALILAAGWATRLGPLAGSGPKHLLPIGSRTALDFVVDRVDALARVGRIDVLTHEAFRPRFEAWAAQRRTRRPLRVWGNGTRSPAARRGAVGDVQWFLEAAAPAEALLVLGGDMVFDFGLEELAAVAEAEPVVAVYDVGSRELVRRYATVELDAGGRVVRFVEKDPDPRTTLAAPALYGLPATALAEVGAYLRSGGSPDNLGFLMEWLVGRRPVRGARVAGRWIDIGSPDEYARARREFGGATG